MEITFLTPSLFQDLKLTPTLRLMSNLRKAIEKICHVKNVVTESGAQLLAVQKPRLEGQDWWKFYFISGASNQGRGQTHVQRPTPH